MVKLGSSYGRGLGPRDWSQEVVAGTTPFVCVNLKGLEVLNHGVMSTGISRSLDKMLVTFMSSLEA